MSAKRFYKTVSVEEGEGGFTIALDGRVVKTPAKALLAMPGRRLAEAVAAEWDAQEKVIDPASMPLTRMANTVIDRVVDNRLAIVESVAAYGGSDLLCYLAPHPEDLTERQRAVWQPWLDWAEKRHGAKLTVSMGIMPQDQDAAALAALEGAVVNADDWELAGLSECVSLTGSLVLGLAIFDDALSHEEAWALSQIDEDYQAEHWGEDAEAAQARANKRQALFEAVTFLKAVRGG